MDNIIKIEEVANDRSRDEKVKIIGLLKSVEVKHKTNKEEYLHITIVDKTGEISFPIWDKVAIRKERLIEGGEITVVGTITEFQFQKQIRVEGVAWEPLDAQGIMNYLPSYEITQDLRDSFTSIINDELSEPYASIVKEALRLCGDRFYTCPAAANHHHNKIGGLFVHTLGVLMNVVNIVDGYVDNPILVDAGNVINRDRVIASAILHDICKVDEYEYTSTIKRKDGLPFDHRLMFFTFINEVNDNLDKVLEKAQIYELQSLVLRHHGVWGAHQPNNIEAMILHLADMIDSQIVGCAENNNPKVSCKMSRMIDTE